MSFFASVQYLSIHLHSTFFFQNPPSHISSHLSIYLHQSVYPYISHTCSSKSIITHLFSSIIHPYIHLWNPFIHHHLSTCLMSSINPSIHSSFNSPIHQSTYPLFIHPSIHQHPSIHPLTHPSIHQLTHSSINTHPSIHQLTHPSINSPIHPSTLIHPSINTYPSIHWLIHPSINSPIHPLTHPSIHQLTHLSINSFHLTTH